MIELVDRATTEIAAQGLPPATAKPPRLRVCARDDETPGRGRLITTRAPPVTS